MELPATLSSSATDGLDVIRQFVKDMEFVWPESPQDEGQIARDIIKVIESWDLGEQSEGCFKYVNYGIIVAKVSRLCSSPLFLERPIALVLVLLRAHTELQSARPLGSHHSVSSSLCFLSIQLIIQSPLKCCCLDRLPPGRHSRCIGSIHGSSLR